MTTRFFALLAFMSFCSFTKPSLFIDNNNYPKDFFGSPVNHEIEVTGTFGELRPNHFHGGIDIRPRNSGVSEPIFAAADGYVQRISISAYGYGKMIQIMHNNGFSSLYAHLDDLTPELNEFVKASQYANESFEVNLYPNAGTFYFKKGQQIGMMGNTGGSQGTHLHFEIREGGSDHGLNPLLFGFNVPDDKSPKFYELKIYSLDENHQTIGSREINLRAKGTTKKVKVKKGKKTKVKTIHIPAPEGSPYSIEGDTIDVNADNIGFGIKAFDTANWSGNTNGIYELSLFKDESEIFNFNVERISFDETRYINAHIDYREKSSGGGYFNRCYRLPGNQLSIYRNLQNDGVIQLYPQQINEVMMVAKDANANPDTLIFYIRRSNQNTSYSQPTNNEKHLYYNSSNDYNQGDCSLYFPMGCLYESFNMTFDENSTKNALGFSPWYRVHQSSTPLHSDFEIKIRPTNVPDSLRGKLCVVFKDGDGDLIFCGNTWQGDYLLGKNNTFGSYAVIADTTAPSIKPVRFSEDMRNDSRMSFRIGDNIKLGKKGIKITARVDNQWILLENDMKSPTFTHRFDDRISSGEHELLIEAEDKCGNISVFRKRFVR
jgi:hypothetical protein